MVAGLVVVVALLQADNATTRPTEEATRPTCARKCTTHVHVHVHVQIRDKIRLLGFTTLHDSRRSQFRYTYFICMCMCICSADRESIYLSIYLSIYHKGRMCTVVKLP